VDLEKAPNVLTPSVSCFDVIFAHLMPPGRPHVLFCAKKVRRARQPITAGTASASATVGWSAFQRSGAL
jgi:hypothetical protein